jgi:hypothetical protein
MAVATDHVHTFTAFKLALSVLKWVCGQRSEVLMPAQVEKDAERERQRQRLIHANVVSNYSVGSGSFHATEWRRSSYKKSFEFWDWKISVWIQIFSHFVLRNCRLVHACNIYVCVWVYIHMWLYVHMCVQISICEMGVAVLLFLTFRIIDTLHGAESVMRI